MAANATFALKPGVWFLRVRFVISAPDSRREPSPPSGRKSTQPTVQILEASSQLSGIQPLHVRSIHMESAPNLDHFANQFDRSSRGVDPHYADRSLRFAELERDLSDAPHIRFSRTEFNAKRQGATKKSIQPQTSAYAFKQSRPPRLAISARLNI